MEICLHSVNCAWDSPACDLCLWLFPDSQSPCFLVSIRTLLISCAQIFWSLPSATISISSITVPWILASGHPRNVALCYLQHSDWGIQTWVILHHPDKSLLIFSGRVGNTFKPVTLKRIFHFLFMYASLLTFLQFHPMMLPHKKFSTHVKIFLFCKCKTYSAFSLEKFLQTLKLYYANLFFWLDLRFYEGGK